MHEDYVCEVLGPHRHDAELKAVAVIIIVIKRRDSAECARLGQVPRECSG